MKILESKHRLIINQLDGLGNRKVHQRINQSPPPVQQNSITKNKLDNPSEENCYSASNFPPVMESERSLPCSQKPIIGTHADPDENNSHPHTKFVRSLFALSFHVRVFWSDPFLFPTKSLYAFLIYHECYMHLPFCFPSFKHRNKIKRPVTKVPH